MRADPNRQSINTYITYSYIGFAAVYFLKQCSTFIMVVFSKPTTRIRHV